MGVYSCKKVLTHVSRKMKASSTNWLIWIISSRPCSANILSRICQIRSRDTLNNFRIYHFVFRYKSRGDLYNWRPLFFINENVFYFFNNFYLDFHTLDCYNGRNFQKVNNQFRPKNYYLKDTKPEIGWRPNFSRLHWLILTSRF